MKKLIFSIGLTTITALAHGQGTIAFGNSALTRVRICAGNQLLNATSADGLIIGVFFGPDASHLTQAQGTASIGTTDGVMINAPSVFALAGTDPGQVVSLQIRAWDAAGRFNGHTDVRQVTLAPTAGPGTVIWQTATGTNPNRFNPMVVNPLVCPEPSMFAFGALGGLVLLWRVRNRGTK